MCQLNLFWVQIFRGFLHLCGKKSCKFPIKGAKVKEKVRSHADPKKRELIRDKKGEEFVLSKSHDEIRFAVSRSCAYSIFSSFFVSRYLGDFCTFSGNLLEKKSCKFPPTGTKI